MSLKYLQNIIRTPLIDGVQLCKEDQTNHCTDVMQAPHRPKGYWSFINERKADDILSLRQLPNTLQ